MRFCPLFSGSSGNSIFVGENDTNILIDVGMPGKSIDKELSAIGVDPKTIDGIFITHEHSDHIKGVGVLSRKYDIPIYAPSLTWEAMEGKVGAIKEKNIKLVDDKYTELNNLIIENFPISHDAACPRGYKVYGKSKKACIATDLGYFSPEVKSALDDSDIILLESNHDIEMVKFGPYPYPLKKRILSTVGHLSNEACGKAIVDIFKDEFKTIYLGHLSKTNNYPELAYETVVSVLRENNIDIKKDLELRMCNRDKHSLLLDI
ncbi:MBL fold metallo-hydrolase [Clostridium culturomicium]|uniref:MBL fold metallo-hydrolase n=1 Tax=Clostridium culturomicium TaxID=1499683 RepID=UPI003857A076